MLLRAAAEGKRIKLLALAELSNEGYRLTVGPVALPTSHPLAQLGPEQMGVVFHTDVCGVVSASIVEATPMPTAFAMLRDLLEIYSHERVHL
jgi:homoserine dehydrogenase